MPLIVEAADGRAGLAEGVVPVLGRGDARHAAGGAGRGGAGEQSNIFRVRRVARVPKVVPRVCSVPQGWQKAAGSVREAGRGKGGELTVCACGGGEGGHTASRLVSAGEGRAVLLREV